MDVPGFVIRDGWNIAPVDDALRTWMATPLPRPFGPLQQMRADLRSPQARLLYLAVLGLGIYAAVQQSLPAVVLAATLVSVFARSFFTALRLRQRGVLGTTSIAFVEQELKARGVNKNVTVDGRTMSVVYQLAGPSSSTSSTWFRCGSSTARRCSRSSARPTGSWG